MFPNSVCAHLQQFNDSARAAESGVNCFGIYRARTMKTTTQRPRDTSGVNVLIAGTGNWPSFPSHSYPQLRPCDRIRVSHAPADGKRVSVERTPGDGGWHTHTTPTRARRASHTLTLARVHANSMVEQVHDLAFFLL